MVKDFEKSLSSLKNSSVNVSDAGSFPEPGTAGVDIDFSDGTRLRAAYWRFLDTRAPVSSFDHQQKYGLPAPIDAISELQRRLQNKVVIEAKFDKETGDLVFQFNENAKLQILNLTSCEDWEIDFSDGTGEYSNYVRGPAR